MNTQSNMLLLFATAIKSIIPINQDFWIASNGDNIIDNNLDFIVFNNVDPA